MSETETEKPPRYMAQLLDALGWNQGTRIPLADPLNQDLETLLIKRFVYTLIYKSKSLYVVMINVCGGVCT